MNPTQDDQTSDSIRLAGATLGEYRHVCAFFRSADEEYRVLLPFITEGFARGDNAFHIVNSKLRDEHLRRLESAGIDVAEAKSNGQLELRTWQDTYFHDGRFDSTRMLAMMESELEDVRGRGFPLSRFVSHMEWALENLPGVNDLLEYETRFNLVPSHGDPIICVYDLTRFGADTVIDAIRTHPMVIIGGILHQNPFFIPPDEFLLGWRNRDAGRNTSHLT